MKKTFFIITTLFTFSLLAGCATRPSTKSTYAYRPLIQPGSGITHTLVKGETIWRLAETYGVSANSILKANRIANPSDLKVGTRIFIPGVGQSVRVRPYLPDSNKWKYIIIHHSATEVGNAELFDKGHRRRGFWNGLGYHFVIDNDATRDGQIETGHRWNHQTDGAHCNTMDMNKKAIGICLVGNFDKDQVSSQQMASLVWLVRQLQIKYHIPSKRVLQHREVPGKNGTHCPGLRFPWKEFRRQTV
ncbi:MAG: N-acetylmuramoyl-L-alanine amidase [Candidatus Omnitrophica bacterium]|nr:N-acetylmuramoyl-L-alanine amidase [Candidatus Omnitrophota bacterium]